MSLMVTPGVEELIGTRTPKDPSLYHVVLGFSVPKYRQCSSIVLPFLTEMDWLVLPAAATILVGVVGSIQANLLNEITFDIMHCVLYYLINVSGVYPLSIHKSIHCSCLFLLIYILTIYQPACPSINSIYIYHPFICLYINPFTYSLTHLPRYVCPSSTHPFIHKSIHP